MNSKPIWDGRHVFNGDEVTIPLGFYRYYKGWVVEVIMSDVKYEYPNHPYEKYGVVVRSHWFNGQVSEPMITTHGSFTGQFWDPKAHAYVQAHVYIGPTKPTEEHVESLSSSS